MLRTCTIDRLLKPSLLALLIFAARVVSFQGPLRNLASSIRFSQNRFTSLVSLASAANPVASSDSDSETMSTSHRSSLISSFLVDVAEEGGNHVWSLTAIDDVLSGDDKSESISSGAKSWKALHTITRQSSTPTATLKSRLRGNTIEIEVEAAALGEDQSELLFVLARVMAQCTAASSTKDISSQKWTIIITSNSLREELPDVSFTADGANTLFETNAEIVDMVDQEGNVLGMVPRSFVHSLNILHRGVGLTVSKDAEFSELYVHRRTDFKRIFPSLYDMFVGGVSVTGESSKLTAAREVAEELGLSGALDEQGQPNHKALSDPLFTCVVCTSYNRCVVTVFQYTIQDPLKETISWQEEEVSWGEFVPYNVVEAAGDLSIQRLVSKKEWPGMLPAVQSKWKGSNPQQEGYDGEDWKDWDFVPDGLLVWEAWLKWRAAL